MHIEKKLVMRTSGEVFSCMGMVRVLSDDHPVIPHGAWEEATEWINKDHVVNPSQIKDFCKELTERYIIRQGYADDEEEFF